MCARKQTVQYLNDTEEQLSSTSKPTSENDNREGDDRAGAGNGSPEDEGIGRWESVLRVRDEERALDIPALDDEYNDEVKDIRMELERAHRANIY